MAGGGLPDGGPGKRAHLYEHKFTIYFAFTCVVGALGGSLFGYDLGVSGFFPLLLLSNSIQLSLFIIWNGSPSFFPCYL